MLGDFNSCNVFQISFDLATPGESTLDPHRHNLEFVSDGCSTVSYKLIDGIGWSPGEVQSTAATFELNLKRSLQVEGYATGGVTAE